MTTTGQQSKENERRKQFSWRGQNEKRSNCYDPPNGKNKIKKSQIEERERLRKISTKYCFHYRLIGEKVRRRGVIKKR